MLFKYLVIGLLLFTMPPAFADVVLNSVDLNCPSSFQNDVSGTFIFIIMCPFSGLFLSGGGGGGGQQIGSPLATPTFEPEPDELIIDFTKLDSFYTEIFRFNTDLFDFDIFIHPDDVLVLLSGVSIFIVGIVIFKKLKKNKKYVQVIYQGR